VGLITPPGVRPPTIGGFGLPGSTRTAPSQSLVETVEDQVEPEFELALRAASDTDKDDGSFFFPS
jgi:hypothetical protein